MEASQVLTTAIIEFNRTWTQNYQLDTIIKRSGLQKALTRMAEDLPAVFKPMPQSYQFYLTQNKIKKGQYLRQQL